MFGRLSLYTVYYTVYTLNHGYKYTGINLAELTGYGLYGAQVRVKTIEPSLSRASEHIPTPIAVEV